MRIKRRHFISLLGGATALTLGCRSGHAQQQMPVIGLLMPGTPEGSVNIATFRKGLIEAGYDYRPQGR